MLLFPSSGWEAGLQHDPFTEAALAEESFLSFGTHHIAYIKPIVIDGKRAVGIYSAAGEQIMTAPSVEVALGLVRHSDMEPALVH